MAFDALGFVAQAASYAKRNRGRSAVMLLAVMALFSAAAGILDKFVFVLIIFAELVLAFLLGEWQLRKIGVELITFVTVLVGFAYGPAAGLVMGGILITLHFILARNIGAHLVYCIPAMALVGFAAGYGHALQLGIALLGVSLSALYNVVTGAIGTVMFGDFPDELVWGGTNFALNYVLFTAAAPAILALVA